MPVTKDQAILIAALAKAIRAETSGAGDWDAPGIIAQLEHCRAMSLAEVMRAVSRLAEDAGVKTPGGLKDMRNPCWRERVIVQTPRMTPIRDRCDVCGQGEHMPTDHTYQPTDPRRDSDTSTEVAHLRGLIRKDESA
jgi:hypothetical protein